MARTHPPPQRGCEPHPGFARRRDDSEWRTVFKLDSEKALLAAFRPRDRKVVELPAHTAFPLVVHDYFAWTHPAGGRVYLVFAIPGGAPTGIRFDNYGGGLGPAVPHMCDWCHSPGMGTSVGMLSTYVNAKKRVGVHVCIDLSCQQKLEDEADRGGYSARPAIEKLIARMGQFASEALKISPQAARR